MPPADVATRVEFEPLTQATEQHPHARALLGSALAGEPSHAYLFAGPSGVGKAAAARAFAAALLADGAVDRDAAVDRAMRGLHPDLTWVAPSGAHEYRLPDIQTPIVIGATRTAMESTRRVFVLERAELLSDRSANSMLKTLEEPGAHVHFILLSSDADRMLETIASRCLLVRFDAPPVQLLADQLVADGVDPVRALSCAGISGGDAALARLLASDEGDAMRSEAGRIVGCGLKGVSGRERPWEAVLARASEAGELAEAQEIADLEEALDAFPKGRERTAAQKEGEQSAKRTARRLRSESLDLSLKICALLLRDIAAAAGGAADLVIAQDRAESILRSGDGRKVGPLLDAISEVEATRRMITRNVAEELTLQALSFKLDRLLAGA